MNFALAKAITYVAIHFIYIFLTVVPKPLIKVRIINDQLVAVGDLLTLESTITTVRGITSRVDVVWSSTSDGTELKRTEGLNDTSVVNDSVIYTDFYTILQLSTLDEARAITCDVLINTISPVMATDSVTLNVTGKFLQ